MTLHFLENLDILCQSHILKINNFLCYNNHYYNMIKYYNPNYPVGARYHYYSNAFSASKQYMVSTDIKSNREGTSVALNSITLLKKSKFCLVNFDPDFTAVKNSFLRVYHTNIVFSLLKNGGLIQYFSNKVIHDYNCYYGAFRVLEQQVINYNKKFGEALTVEDVI